MQTTLFKDPVRTADYTLFITEMKSVYCAVRTRSLNKAVSASYLKVNVISAYVYKMPSKLLGL